MIHKIDSLIAFLEEQKIAELTDYKQRLTDNANNADVFNDLIFESSAALMFSRYGFKVTIRETPDLKIELNGTVIYAEVKHFRKKEQDQIDEQAMRESRGFRRTGNLVSSEGDEAWQQIAKVASKKSKQYVTEFPNLLVIASDSNSVNGIRLSTAVSIYDEKACKPDALQLRKLNGFLLMDSRTYLNGPEQLVGTGTRNVVFYSTSCVTIPLSTESINALENIRKWERLQLV